MDVGEHKKWANPHRAEETLDLLLPYAGSELGYKRDMEVVNLQMPFIPGETNSLNRNLGKGGDSRMWSYFNSGPNAGMIIVRDQSDSINEGQYRERNGYVLAGSNRPFAEFHGKPNHGDHMSYLVELDDPWDDKQ